MMQSTSRRLYRAVLWAYLWVQVKRIHRVLRSGGFKAASQQFLRLPKPGHARSFSERELEEFDELVMSACSCQGFPSGCLHRAITSYFLFRGLGGRPVFCMAIAGRPFVGHAWCEVEGCRIADPNRGGIDLLETKIVLRIPTQSV